jgi:twinkle protein
MANFIKHTECPLCGSSDGNSIYDNNTSYCFVCERITTKETLGANQMLKEFTNETLEVSFTQTEMIPIDRSIRGITSSTFQKYSYGKTDKGDHVINHYGNDNLIVAQKFRYKDKTFSWKGQAKKATPFGLHLWRSGGKRITITEGELDCLSVAEALGCKYPVISINNGAQSAVRDLKEHIEILNSYDEICLWFDNDEAGQKAVKEVSALFPVGKVVIINSAPYKDANQILQEKGKATVLQYYYEAKKYAPDGIISGSSLNFEDIISINDTASILTPYTELNRMTRGLRKGELVTFTAGTGIGKTTAVREIAYDMLINKNLKIGWVALEENTQRSALGFMSLYLNNPIYMSEEREIANKEELKVAFDTVINTDNIHFFDHFGSLDSENLINKMRYLAVSANVDFIFLDHISIVVSGGKEADNERLIIDKLMTQLRSLSEETGVGIVVISHLRKPTGDKGFENGVEITLNHLRGSGSIAQLSDTVIALERNQQSKEDNTIANVRILKNRYAGTLGLAGSVKYYKNTGRLLEYLGEEALNANFINEIVEDEF